MSTPNQSRASKVSRDRACFKTCDGFRPAMLKVEGDLRYSAISTELDASRPRNSLLPLSYLFKSRQYILPVVLSIWNLRFGV